MNLRRPLLTPCSKGWMNSGRVWESVALYSNIEAFCGSIVGCRAMGECALLVIPGVHGLGGLGGGVLNTAISGVIGPFSRLALVVTCLMWCGLKKVVVNL